MTTGAAPASRDLVGEADPGVRTRLAVALALSLMVHAAVVVGVRPGWLGSDAGVRALDLARADEPDEPTTHRLGLETSSAVSINWIGFVDGEQTPMARDRARFEQPELTRLPEAPAIDDAPLAQLGPPEPQPPELTTPTPQPEPPSQPEARPEAEPAPARASSPSVIAPQPQPPEATAVVPDVAQPTTEPSPQPVPTTPAPVPDQAAEPSPSTQPAAPAGAPATAPDPGRSGVQRRAERSDRDASAVARTFDVNPWRQTRPLAGEGIEIRTVAPREIPIAERTLLRQTRVVLDIRFGPDGVVKSADFAEIKDDLDRPVRTRTGNPYIDGPIKDAVYRWRASGPVIRAVSPGQTITVRMRINIS
jgi:hypothetical protein